MAATAATAAAASSFGNKGSADRSLNNASEGTEGPALVASSIHAGGPVIHADQGGSLSPDGAPAEDGAAVIGLDPSGSDGGDRRQQLLSEDPLQGLMKQIAFMKKQRTRGGGIGGGK